MSSISPRKRSSLVAGRVGSQLSHGISSAGAGGPAASSTAFKALRKSSSKAWPYAPCSARYRLSEARDTVGSTAAQFAQAISCSLSDAPVNQQQLLAMEAGFAPVPVQVLAGAERLLAEHQAELERQKAAHPAAGIVGGDYPYQEPMEGVDFQIAPPRYLGGVGGSKALSREARKDELVFQPKMPPCKLADYLDEARAILTRADGPLCFSEEVSLSILHDLRYNPEAALAALRHCVTWTKSPGSDLPAKTPGRAAAANSVLWLQRLREHAKHNTWCEGDKEALDAGIAEHGKELAIMHRAQHLCEKSLPQIIEMYYVAGVPRKGAQTVPPALGRGCVFRSLSALLCSRRRAIKARDERLKRERGDERLNTRADSSHDQLARGGSRGAAAAAVEKGRTHRPHDAHADIQQLFFHLGRGLSLVRRLLCVRTVC